MSRELQLVKRLWEEAVIKVLDQLRGSPGQGSHELQNLARGCAWPDLTWPAFVEIEVGWQAAMPTRIRVPLAASMLSRQSPWIAAGTTCPAKPPILTLWLFLEMLLHWP